MKECTLCDSNTKLEKCVSCGQMYCKIHFKYHKNYHERCKKFYKGEDVGEEDSSS